jgi:hypothetical protein
MFEPEALWRFLLDNWLTAVSFFSFGLLFWLVLQPISWLLGLLRDVMFPKIKA